MVECQNPSSASASAYSLLCSHCNLSDMCAGRVGEVDGETTTRAPPNCIRCGDSAIEKKGSRRGVTGILKYKTYNCKQGIDSFIYFLIMGKGKVKNSDVVR